MKKIMYGMGLAIALFGMSHVIHAGQPQDQGAQLSGKFFHTAIYGSSTTAATTNLLYTIAAPANTNSGGQTISYQNCFTKLVFQLSTGAVAYVYDGSTVTTSPAITIYGAGLGTSGANTISLPQDHLGPFCTTLGNATNVLLSSGTAAGMVGTNVLNFEGYTSAGAGSISN